MQTKFFGRNALGGVFCTLLTGLIFVVATSCGGDGGGGDSSDSKKPGSSSGSKVDPDIPSPNVSISDTTFRWYMETRQDEVVIDVSVRLTGGDDDVKGFDKVLVKLSSSRGGSKTLNEGGQEQRFYQYKSVDGDINVEDELGLEAVCGADVSLTVEVYAFGNREPEMRASKTLKKDADTGNCRSSSSNEQSSSSAFQIKTLVSVGTISVKNGEGVNLATAGEGNDLTVSITTSGGRETTIEAGSNYSMTDQFLKELETGSCGTRGFSYNPESENYVGGNFDTSKFYPCLDASMGKSFDCRNTFKLVKAGNASEATDWTQGWYLIYCIEEGAGVSSAAKIQVWKVNN